jgi:hypothetical protein
MIMQGCPFGSFLHLLTKPYTLLVSEAASAETLKISSFAKELAVEDFPWPVIPMRQIDLNVLESISGVEELFSNRGRRDLSTLRIF